MIIGPRERAGLTLGPVSGPQAKTTAASENPIATAATPTGAWGSAATATMTRTRAWWRPCGFHERIGGCRYDCGQRRRGDPRRDSIGVAQRDGQQERPSGEAERGKLPEQRRVGRVPRSVDAGQRDQLVRCVRRRRLRRDRQGAGTAVRAHQSAISASVSGSIPANFAASSALRP